MERNIVTKLDDHRHKLSPLQQERLDKAAELRSRRIRRSVFFTLGVALVAGAAGTIQHSVSSAKPMPGYCGYAKVGDKQGPEKIVDDAVASQRKPLPANEADAGAALDAILPNPYPGDQVILRFYSQGDTTVIDTSSIALWDGNGNPCPTGAITAWPLQ